MTSLPDPIGLLATLGEQMFWMMFLVFMRVGAVMTLLPAFGEQAVPQRIRLGLTLAFTAIVAPAIIEGEIPPGILLPIAAEVLLGLVLGIGLRCFVLTLQMAGTIAAQATSLSQLFGGAAPEPQPAIGNVLITAGLALAVMNGLHVSAAELLILSYDMLPVGRMPTSADLADWGLDQVTRAFSLSFMLAAPFLAASLIFNIALGAINRAMPQLMVAFVGAPALTLGGLALLAIITPLALSIWQDAFSGFLAFPFRAIP